MAVPTFALALPPAPSRAREAPSNQEIASVLERVADLLELQEANPFRIRSYRSAAVELRGLPRPAAEILAAEGRAGLRRISGVGRALSATIAEIVETGRLGLMERLESELAPESAFRRLPGIGPELARRIHDELGVSTLEELEHAAHDGRLLAVEGIGEKRARGIRDVLAGILGRSTRRSAAERIGRHVRPDVALLLEIDAEYRHRAHANQLRRIAPRRFNPANEAWLPVLEVTRDGWELTALFSNTRRAHELGRTFDWVVIYYDRDAEHGQCTVVTARRGVLQDRRVVRGREPECRQHYARRAALPAPDRSRVA